MENKNLTIMVLIIAVVLVGIFIFLNMAPKKEPVIETPTTSTVTAPTTSTLIPPDIPLSEFQITACNAADRGGTCETRLPRLGLVSKEDCCKYLGKCC